jgi:thiamine biosynthesis lipoprotein
MSEENLARRAFGIMGTFAELLVRTEDPAVEQAFDDALTELQRINSVYSRFDPTSPIERLNDNGGGPIDAEMRMVLDASLKAWHDTGGRVDVGIGADLIAAGYDRDFDELDVPDDNEIRKHAATLQVAGARAVHNEPAFEYGGSGELIIRPGRRIDLGGIVKGWASDRICSGLSNYGSALVNLGGDIALSVADGDDPWPIGIEIDGENQSFALAFGGMATSGQDRRVWKGGDGEFAHHVIDPRTGRSASTDILRITVIGGSCIEAEVWAKALILIGRDAAVAEANVRGITSVIIDTDQRATFTGGLT